MDKKFEFKELDIEGAEILDVIAHANKFNKWMYDTINPYCKGNILEIGSGIGNISQFFIENNQTITVTDIRDNYCEILTKKFSPHNNLKGILNMDLTHPNFDIEYQHLLATFDSVFALNVVEHIEDDNLAISNCYKLLKNNGNLIILVPAYQFLYNQFDVELEHYRRYTLKQLGNIFKNNSFKLINSQYFNLAGILGWYVSGKLQKNKSIPKDQMSLYNTLVPIFKLFDKLSLNKAGLSVIQVGVKTA